MPDLSVSYLGLELKSPIIAGSSGLTNSIESLREIEKAGAGAVVLKSVFEEEIYLEYAEEMKKLGPMDNNLEFLDYYDYEIRQGNLKRYIQLVSDAKKALTIPVIASINCVSNQEWSFFAKKLEEAGADAIELNMFIRPSDLSQNSRENESIYFDVATRVASNIKIPLSLKISSYFSNLGGMIRDLSFAEISGLVLFNKFYSPDIDVENEKLISADVFSTDSDYTLPLRWIGIMAKRVNCDLAASTGVHDWKTVVRMLLAGASAVQVVSAMYIDGVGVLKELNQGLSDWMEKRNYSSIADFKGKLSIGNDVDPAAYMRVQFMRNFGEHD